MIHLKHLLFNRFTAAVLSLTCLSVAAGCTAETTKDVQQETNEFAEDIVNEDMRGPRQEGKAVDVG